MPQSAARQMLNVVAIPEEGLPAAESAGPLEARQLACEASWRSRGHAFANLGAGRATGGPGNKGLNISAARRWVSVRWRGSAAYNRNWVPFFLPRAAGGTSVSVRKDAGGRAGRGAMDTGTDTSWTDMGAETDAEDVSMTGSTRIDAAAQGGGSAAMHAGAGATVLGAKRVALARTQRGGVGGGAAALTGSSPLRRPPEVPAAIAAVGSSSRPRLSGGPMMVVYSFNPHVVLSCDRSSGGCSLAAASVNRHPLIRRFESVKLHLGPPPVPVTTSGGEEVRRAPTISSSASSLPTLSGQN